MAWSDAFVGVAAGIVDGFDVPGDVHPRELGDDLVGEVLKEVVALFDAPVVRDEQVEVHELPGPGDPGAHLVKATPAPALLVSIARNLLLSSSGRDASISPSVDSFTRP